MGITVKSILSRMGVNIGNLNEYPIQGTKYIVILGLSILSFSKISGITLYSANIRGLNEGGMNEPYLVEEPNNTPSVMKLEKGYGTVDVLQIIDKAKVMLLLIKGQDNKIKGAYYTSRMMIKEVTLSDLDAGKSGILIQTMTISYTNLKPVNAVMGMGSMFGLDEIISSLLDYNNDEDDRASVAQYAAKLSAQKREKIQKVKKEREERARKAAEKEKKQKGLSNVDSPAHEAIHMAANTNKQISQANAQLTAMQEAEKAKALEQIKSQVEF